MNKQRLIQRLMATFLGEFDEHLRALDRDVLLLERAGATSRVEILTKLFRTVHSLKGAARSVELGLIEAVCHRLETIFAAAREGVLALDTELVQLLFTCVDALKDASARLRSNQALAGGPLGAVLPQLDAVASDLRFAQARPTSESSESSESAPPSDAASTDGLVRMPAEKLDVLLARSCEFLVARRRAGARLEDLHRLQELLEQTESEWRRAEKLLTGLPRRPELPLERTREHFKRLARGMDSLMSRAMADQHVLEQTAAALDDEVRRARMMPFRDACEGLERAIRDLARSAGKHVELVVEGSDVALDRSILEGLKDPLLQLVRNAVVHGLESPDERSLEHKPITGRITVTAALRGAGIVVVVADDGGGLDLDRIREQARERGLPVPDDERELARLVFLPGFSTARCVTELSGRGVGLDVVRHRVESLHGSVDFSFEPGRGTRFVLMLPLTLTTLRGLLVGCHGQVFALPTSSVHRLARVGPAQQGSVEGRAVLLGDDEAVPIAALAEVLGIADAAPRSGKLALAVVATGRRRVAFAVDELLAEQDLIVKSLGARLRHIRNFTGATLLPTGRLALILNPAELVHAALAPSVGTAKA